MFVLLTSGLLLLALEPHTAEFVLMAAMLVCSSVFLAVLAVYVRVFSKR